MYRLLCTFCFCSVLAFGTRLAAQDTPATPFQPSPVEVSQVVDTILGKAYRVHTVQKGHTLYSICRAYQTSADSILKDSPDNQVQIDELIYIPFHFQANEKPQDLTRFTGKRPWAVVFMQKDENTENLIFAENPEKKEKIKNRREHRKDEEQEEKTVTDTTSATAVDTLLISITDTVFVTPHPNAKENKEELRISLLLPLYSSTPQDKKAYIYLPFFEGATIAWQEFNDPLFFVPPVTDTAMAQDSTLTVQDSITNSDTDNKTIESRGVQTQFKHTQAHKQPDKFQPLPISPAESDTSKVRIHFKLYDLTQSADALNEIVNDPEFKQSDAVIATAFVDQFQILDSLSKAWEIPIIHPISERDMMSIGNPYFIQLAASYSRQINHIADFVKKHHPRAHILIVSDSTENEARKAEYLLSLLTDSSQKTQEVQWLYFNPETVSLLEELSKGTEKTVIIPFYRKEITAVKTVLPLRQSKGNITIIAPNVWLDYPTVDLDYYIQNNLTVYHTFCNAVQNTDFMEFSKHYYLLYHGLPNLLAYQGYKSMSWLINMLKSYNADFMRHLEEADYTNDKENASIYRFMERNAGGFENTDVHFVKVTESKLEHIH